MRPSLSVVIPAHNAGKYLAEAVASVESQGWDGPVEVIVVDDGSTDDTADVAEGLDVSLIRKEKGGAATARNRGLEAATGELVALLDADDVFCDGALDALWAPLEDDASVDASFGLAEDFISPELTDGQKAELSPRDGAYAGILPGCSLIRRSVFGQVGLFDEGMGSGETVAWTMAMRDAGLKTANVPEVTLKRRFHLTNTGRLHKQQEMANYAKLLRARMKKS